MTKNKRVADIADEVLEPQARDRAEWTGEPFEEALKAVVETEASRQLGELPVGHRHDGARKWQERAGEPSPGTARGTAEAFRDAGTHRNTGRSPPLSVADRHYSWLEDYLAWLDEKEGRSEYHVCLGRELGCLKG